MCLHVTLYVLWPLSQQTNLGTISDFCIQASVIGLVWIQCETIILLYSSVGGDGCFAVEKKTGQVVTTGLVLQRDREYLLSIVALDGLGSRSAPAMLSVVAGSRAPQFTNTSYAISIPENTPEGQP